jgi:glycosyltransferase
MQSVSIITACRDAGGVIETCLQSVAAQSVEVEHIIVDGLSTDDTLEVVDRYRTPGMKVVSEADLGIYDALNKGIQLSTSEIIGVLHADDYYKSSDSLSKVLDAFDTEGVDSCYGDLEYVAANDTSKVTRHWVSGPFKKNRFLWGWMPPHPTFFVRREVYSRLCGFRLDLGTAADYELMLRYLYKEEISSTYVPEVLICMRTGGASNRSFSARIKANRMDRLAWRVNNLKPLPWTIPMKPLRKLGQWF